MSLSDDVRVLLDGLSVGSLSELRRLVDAGRAGVVVSPNQIRALGDYFAAGVGRGEYGDVRLRPADRDGLLTGAVHAEPLDPRDRFREVLLAYDVTRNGGSLGITYDALMTLPAREDDDDAHGAP